MRGHEIKMFLQGILLKRAFVLIEVLIASASVALVSRTVDYAQHMRLE